MHGTDGRASDFLEIVSCHRTDDRPTDGVQRLMRLPRKGHIIDDWRQKRQESRT